MNSALFRLWGSSLANLFSTCSIILKKSSKLIYSKFYWPPSFSYYSCLIWPRRFMASAGSLWRLCIIASRSLMFIEPLWSLSNKSKISFRFWISSSVNYIGAAPSSSYSPPSYYPSIPSSISFMFGTSGMFSLASLICYISSVLSAPAPMSSISPPSAKFYSYWSSDSI